MSNLPTILILALALLTSCQDCREESPQILKAGMTMAEAHEILLAHGAKPGEGYYHRPGNDSRSQFYELSDQTCVEIRTKITNHHDVILWFAHGPPGTTYPGKIKWWKAQESGTVQKYESLELP